MTENQDLYEINHAVLNEFKSIMGEGLTEIYEKLDEFSKEWLGILSEGIGAQDYSKVKAAAHSLKSTSRQLGAIKLGDKFDGVEKAIDRGENPDLLHVGQYAKVYEELFGAMIKERG